MIVIAIIGILAAIAVPQFLESVEHAKTAEATATMNVMSDGAVSYFQSEQQKCGNNSDCSSPWHSGTPIGNPVPTPDKTYPGGDSFSMKFVPDIPKSGTKLPPRTGFTAYEKKVVRRLGVELEDPVYFQYRYASNGTGQDATATVEAEADFDPDATDNHLVRQYLHVDGGAPQTRQPFTENEGR